MYDIGELQEYIENGDFGQIFVLTDENTSKYCLPLLLEKVDVIADRQATLLEIPSGEENKNMETVCNLCRSLVESKADRSSLLIGLGGGVLTDMGALTASLYKRGIQNINIPTTLLAMADASIGYKTGVNLDGFKNIIGTFNISTSTFVDYEFLQTLPLCEIANGIAEMLKTFLVYDKDFALRFVRREGCQIPEKEYVLRCMEIKEEIVGRDIYDQNIRQVLNFGHSIGHGLETLYFQRHKKEPLPHGRAVATGMYYALLLSEKIFETDKEEFAEVIDFLKKNFEIANIEPYIGEIVENMLNDKKNRDNKVNLVLLESVGKAVRNMGFEKNEIEKLLKETIEKKNL